MTQAEVRSAMDGLPDDIGDIYKLAMKRVQEQKKQIASLAKQVLSWVHFAKSPLSVKELQHAIAFEARAGHPCEDNLVSEDDILSACVGLVTFSAREGGEFIVQFVRKSPYPCN